MELTWLAVSSVFLVGVGYAFVQKAQQSPFVVWMLVCASLFALSTRDLFQSRERSHPESTPTDGAPDRSSGSGHPVGRPPARADGGGDPPRTRDDSSETTLVVRVFRRVGGWFG